MAMARHSRMRPFSEIRNFIHKDLLQPRKAFVSAAEAFESDWKIFEEESKTLKVRFARSDHGEDFGSMFGYQAASGFNEHVGNMIHQRFKILMEAGVF